RMGLDQVIAARAAISQVCAEAVTHGPVVACEADRDRVHALAILGIGVAGMMNVDQLLAGWAQADHPVRRKPQPLDSQQRRRIVVALWALTLFERGALDLYLFDRADF